MNIFVLVKLKKVINTAIITLFFFSCYEQGPVLSLRSKAERIQNNWLAKFVYDMQSSEDITSQYTDINYQLNINNDGSFSESYDTLGSVIEHSGLWFFENRHKIFRRIYNNGDTIDFYIIKLQERKLWMRADDNTLELQLIGN